MIGWTCAAGPYPQGLRGHCELVFSSNGRAGGRHYRICGIQIMHGKELTHRIGVVSRAPYTETNIARLGTKNELADELAFQVHYAPQEFTPPPLVLDPRTGINRIEAVLAWAITLGRMISYLSSRGCSNTASGEHLM